MKDSELLRLINSGENFGTGCRYARNQLLVNLLRDYRYMEHTGMGIPYTVIPAMRVHNNTDPLLEEREDEFRVTLWAKERGA